MSPDPEPRCPSSAGVARTPAWRRAAQVERAARRVLEDPACADEDVASLVAAGWRHWLAAAGIEPAQAASSETLTESLRESAPRRLADRDRARIAESVPPLLAEDRATPERKELRGATALLRRAVGVLRAEQESLPARIVRQAAPVLVLLAIAAIASAATMTAASRAQHGWRGSYYPDKNLEGTPTVRRDERVDFNWFHDAPVPAVPEDGFSARWDTCLEIEEPTKLELRLGSDDGSRAWLDDRKIIDRWRPQKFTWSSSTVEVEPGRHHLVIDYFEAHGRASVVLKLRYPGLPPEPVAFDSLHVPERPIDADDPCGGP